MAPWQQRVVNEKRDLDEKLVNLMRFMDVDSSYRDLPIDDRWDLHSQALAMRQYSLILGNRISRFKVSPTKE